MRPDVLCRELLTVSPAVGPRLPPSHPTDHRVPGRILHTEVCGAQQILWFPTSQVSQIKMSHIDCRKCQTDPPLRPFPALLVSDERQQRGCIFSLSNSHPLIPRRSPPRHPPRCLPESPQRLAPDDDAEDLIALKLFNRSLVYRGRAPSHRRHRSHPRRTAPQPPAPYQCRNPAPTCSTKISSIETTRRTSWERSSGPGCTTHSPPYRKHRPSMPRGRRPVKYLWHQTAIIRAHPSGL